MKANDVLQKTMRLKQAVATRLLSICRIRWILALFVMMGVPSFSWCMRFYYNGIEYGNIHINGPYDHQENDSLCVVSGLSDDLTSITIPSYATARIPVYDENRVFIRYDEKTFKVVGIESVKPFLSKTSSLETVELPNTVKFIHSDAFKNCDKLTTINLDYVEEIADLAFSGCNGLTSINLKSVRKLGGFSSCRNLEQVVLGDALELIDGGAFEECTSLKHVQFGNSKHTIGNYAFYQCTGLVTFDAGGAKEIGSFAFSGCENL